MKVGCKVMSHSLGRSAELLLCRDTTHIIEQELCAPSCVRRFTN